MIRALDTETDRFLSRAAAPDLVRAYFRRAVARERLAHAYLFTGPAGAGKGRFARQLAQAFFCQTREPCGECAPCRRIEAGEHPSVHVFRSEDRRAALDIAGVRDLIHKDRVRREDIVIWVVEGLEGLAAPAMNVLLKLLEEPHGGSLFLLTAPSAGTVIPTIVSRCQRLLFSLGAARPAPSAGLHDRLRELLDPSFYAENFSRDWLQQLSESEDEDPRSTLVAFIDDLVGAARIDWSVWENEPGPGPDPLTHLESLVRFRSDLDSNVQVELVLEALIRHLRRAAPFILSE